MPGPDIFYTRKNHMRIISRPDFDGIVCAALIADAEAIDKPVKWVEPSDIQKGKADIQKGDIIANLPYHENCSLWFDHHYSNAIKTRFKGSFEIAPSAAGLVYRYYRGRLKRNYDALIRQTDRIDAADLTLDEVLHPEKYIFVLLSMTISGRHKEDEPYWNLLVALLQQHEIETVMADKEVARRCRMVKAANSEYKIFLEKYTRMEKMVSVTDFRSLDHTPEGNRFLVYSMFPEAVVSVRISYADKDREIVAVQVGHSIFNRHCNVNIGRMLTRFEGGGHPGAGACRFHRDKAEQYIPAILEILLKNQPH